MESLKLRKFRRKSRRNILWEIWADYPDVANINPSAFEEINQGPQKLRVENKLSKS